MTTKLPEPNFIDRDPDIITKEWVELYEKNPAKFYSLHKLKG